jgi:biotin carboxyl carrier protein
MTYDVTVDGKSHRVELARGDGARWNCKLDGKPVMADAVLTGPYVLSLIIDGQVYEVKREVWATDLHIWVGSARYDVELRDPRAYRSRRAAGGDEAGPRKVVSPMPGKVLRILAPAGTKVEAGQGVVVVEAMKMQNEIKSPKAGVVQKIVASEGSTVNAGEVLAIVE